MEKINDLMVFSNEEFGEVRVVEVNDASWFVAKDVSDILGYAQTSNMLKRVDAEDFMSSKLDGMNMESKLINESGLYAAIIGSKLPSAKKFKRWVTSEVLPQIRKTGGYIPVKEDDSDLDIMVKAFAIQQKTLEQKDEIIAQKLALIEEQSKTVAFVKMVSYTSENNVKLKEFADTLGIKGLGRNILYKMLREMKIITQGSTLPYRKFIDSRHLVVSQELGRNGKVCYVTYVTPKGQEYLTKRILKELDKHFIHISDDAKDYAKQLLDIIGKSEEEYFAMLVKPESFRDEWEAVARFIRETNSDFDDEDCNIADEIDEMLMEL